MRCVQHVCFKLMSQQLKIAEKGLGGGRPDLVYTKLAELRKLLHGGLDPVRTRELTDEMRAAGLPL